jgi:hypothetical protein
MHRLRTIRDVFCLTRLARAAFVGVVVLAVPAMAEESLPTGLQAYRVSLTVGFEESPALSPLFRERTRRDVLRLLDRTYGERWFVTSEDGVASLARDRTALDRLTPAAVPVTRRSPSDRSALPADDAPDKFLFVTIAADGAGYVAAAREWDRLTDTVGPVRTFVTVSREDVPRIAVGAVRAAFRPVAEIGVEEEGLVALTLRAGEIPAPDPDATALAPQTLFLPVMRRFDRDGELLEVRSLPHTVLRTASSDGGPLVAEVHSSLRSPLGSRRGRVEAWAIGTLTTAESTRLTLIRREDGVPLAGRIVEIRAEPPRPGAEPPPPEATLLTDRSGSVVLAADAERPLVWVTVRSGDALLFRMPLVPGLEAQVTLPLGDDHRRLDAEGRLSILTGELIETVAKRATLLVRARTRARAGQYAEAEEALAEVARLPDAADFRRRLAAVEAPAVQAAQDAGDRLAAARIRALARRAATLVDRYLNADAVRATREEVDELKQTDPSRKGG